ncbi:putative abieta-7,13-dien-18-ol hydroxylase [Rosa chinensis]|uniref:Putative abieta-7,13-dien-18-ol hydroxylase n=2 Tax=Rosa chinensis TaxID=74649 RepID=A0A2P6SMM8_ROSCH|nr:putative abieta-7,13-dien-18-ol hydroxylase [Rosa chinensis]
MLEGEYLHSLISDVVGNEIFSVDGGKWRHQRKTSSSQFSTKVLREFSSEIFKTNAVKVADIVHQAATCNKSIEMQDLFMKSTLDSIVKILLGFDLGTMSGTNNEESIRFSNVFNDANACTLYRLGDIFWKIRRFLNIGMEAVLRENVKVVDQFIYKLINTKIQTLHNLEDDELPLKKRDFISRLLETKETDPKYLRDMVLTFITAGKDTTASALS